MNMPNDQTTKVLLQLLFEANRKLALAKTSGSKTADAQVVKYVERVVVIEQLLGR